MGYFRCLWNVPLGLRVLQQDGPDGSQRTVICLGPFLPVLAFFPACSSFPNRPSSIVRNDDPPFYIFLIFFIVKRLQGIHVPGLEQEGISEPRFPVPSLCSHLRNAAAEVTVPCAPRHVPVPGLRWREHRGAGGPPRRPPDLRVAHSELFRVLRALTGWRSRTPGHPPPHCEACPVWSDAESPVKRAFQRRLALSGSQARLWQRQPLPSVSSRSV